VPFFFRKLVHDVVATGDDAEAGNGRPHQALQHFVAKRIAAAASELVLVAAGGAQDDADVLALGTRSDELARDRSRYPPSPRFHITC
jgi:hypothetical protein